MLPVHQFVRFDVRPVLERGEDPYGQIRRRVDELRPDQGLIIVAPFLPSPLIEKLGSEGFSRRMERGHRGEWIVYFWREPAPSSRSR